MTDITHCAGDPSDILLDRAALSGVDGEASLSLRAPTLLGYNWSESGRQDIGRAQRMWIVWQDVERERSDGDPAGNDSRHGWPPCHSGA